MIAVAGGELMWVTRGLAGRVGITVLLVAPLAAPAGQAVDRAAVPLHTPPVTTPLEAAAAGVAPEVGVRVLVDAAGRVAEVEVTRIEPSTDLDPVFAAATRDALKRWRYAPALAGGGPVETRLEWTIRFAEIGEREPAEPSESWRFHAETEDGTRSYRQSILALPLESRTRLLQEYGERARRHLVPEKTRKSTSPRFVVYTDAPDKDVAQIVAQDMEATFNVLSELLQPWIEPYPEPYRVVVFVYHSESSFSALKREVRSVDWSVGFYNPLGLIALHMEMPSADSLLAVLLHEATHAYIDRYVARPGVVAPRWLDEGLADYISSSQIKKGKLIPGRTRRAEIYQVPWGLMMGRSSEQLTVTELRRALKEGRALSLQEMLAADRREFYGEKRSLYYGLAWLLVHFLRHGDPDWSDEQFSRLVLLVAEGYPPLEALRQTYDDPARMQDRFRDYVMKF